MDSPLNYLKNYINLAKDWAVSHPQLSLAIAISIGILILIWLNIKAVRSSRFATYRVWKEISNNNWDSFYKHQWPSIGLKFRYKIWRTVPIFYLKDKWNTIEAMEMGYHEHPDRNHDRYPNTFRSDEGTVFAITHPKFHRYWWTPWTKVLIYGEILLVLIGMIWFGVTRWQNYKELMPEPIATESSVGGEHIIPTIVQPTEMPPTATPEPEFVNEGDAAVLKIDLSEIPQSTNQFLEWLNAQNPGLNLPIPELDIELPQWIFDLFYQDEAQIIVMPPTLDGYVFISHSNMGLTLYHTNEAIQLNGDPVVIDAHKLTLTARHQTWGIEYSEKKSEFKPPTYKPMGNIEVEVTGSVIPALIVHPQGWKYHFAWWHLAVIATIIVAIGIIAYRRKNY